MMPKIKLLNYSQKKDKVEHRLRTDSKIGVFQDSGTGDAQFQSYTAIAVVLYLKIKKIYQ